MRVKSTVSNGIKAKIETVPCHPDYHERVREWLAYDYWSIDEGHLLLANISPTAGKIADEEQLSRRYGTIEPPVVVEGKLLDWDCNVNLHDRYERLLIVAGKRLRLIRAHWARGMHAECRYSPEYFVEWALSKRIEPCWIELWREWARYNFRNGGGDASFSLATVAEKQPITAADTTAPTRAAQSQDAACAATDWRDRARALAQAVGETKWRTGIRQVTARNICDAVASELAKDAKYHGIQGPRTASNIRNEALKGWKFLPPSDAARVD